MGDIKPGFYWVRFPEHTDKKWSVGEIDEDGDLYVVGWDAGVRLPAAEFGPRIEPPGVDRGPIGEFDGPGGSGFCRYCGVADPGPHRSVCPQWTSGQAAPASDRYVAIHYSETTPEQRARPRTRVLFWCENEEHARREAALWNAGRAERAVQGVRDDYEWAILDTRPDLPPGCGRAVAGQGETMKIQHGEGCTEYGPGVAIELTGDEVARAIDAYLVARGVHVSGARTITMTVAPHQQPDGSARSYCGPTRVYVDPSGFVIADGVKFNGRGGTE
jgi:hypothetical protein